MGTAAHGDEVGVELLGHAAYFVGAGDLVDEGGDKKNVHAFQVFVGVYLAAAVFEPDLPLVEVRAVPLGQRSGKEEHPLSWDGYELEVAARRPGLNQYYSFNSRHWRNLRLSLCVVVRRGFCP